MSNIIKKRCVAYSEIPKAVNFQIDGVLKTSDDVRQILTDNALENAEISLKSAYKKYAEIGQNTLVETQLAYSVAHKNGIERGYADALNNRQEQNEQQAKAKVNETMGSFIDCVRNFDNAYREQINTAKNECVDFAFSLAENILNIDINRQSDDFKAEIEAFMKLEPGVAILEVDGCEYNIESLKSENLVSCADGIENINVIIPPFKAELYETYEKAENEGETNLELPQQFHTETAELPVEIKVENADMDIIETRQVQTKTAETPEIENAENVAEDILETQQQCPAEITEPQVIEEKTQAETGDFLKTEHQDNAGDDNEENFFDSETRVANNGVPEEKYVYIRPSSRKAVLPSGVNSAGKRVFKFEDIPLLGSDNLKLLMRKAEINDITAAFQGAPEDAVSAVLEACTRRTKEKILDGIKYLGPVPESEVQDARIRLTQMADELALH